MDAETQQHCHFHPLFRGVGSKDGNKEDTRGTMPNYCMAAQINFITLLHLEIPIVDPFWFLNTFWKIIKSGSLHQGDKTF